MVVRRRLSSFDGANPAGWLYRITRRQVRDFRRRSWVRHIFTKRRLEEPDDLPHAGGTPAAALERKEDRRILHAMLSKMREERRSAFVLFEIEGLSGEEIARIQSVPINTVWTRLYHARREFFALAAKYQARERDARPEEGTVQMSGESGGGGGGAGGGDPVAPGRRRRLAREPAGPSTCSGPPSRTRRRRDASSGCG